MPARPRSPYDLPGDPPRNPFPLDLARPSRVGRRLPCPRRRRRRGRALGLGVRLLAGRRRLGRRGRREEALPTREDLRRRAHAAVGTPTRRHGTVGRPGRRTPLRRPAGVRLRDEPRDALARSPLVPVGGLRDHPPRPRPARRRTGRQGRRHGVGGSRGDRARSSTRPPPVTVGGAGTSAEVLPSCAGAKVLDRDARTAARGAGPLHGGGRRGELALRPGAGHLEGPGLSPRHGSAGLLPLTAPRRRRSSSPTSTSETRRERSCRATAGSSPSATGG